MEEDVIGWLLSGAGISALAAGRINWNERPQGESLPAVTLTLIGGGPRYLASGARVDMTRYLVQADCWGATALAALQLHRAVQARLEELNSGTGGDLKAAFVERLVQFGEPDDMGGGLKVFRQVMDFAVWRRE